MKESSVVSGATRCTDARLWVFSKEQPDQNNTNMNKALG